MCRLDHGSSLPTEPDLFVSHGESGSVPERLETCAPEESSKSKLRALLVSLFRYSAVVIQEHARIFIIVYTL